MGITQITSGHTHNVIPDLCSIRGSLRTFDEDYRKTIKRQIRELASEMSEKYHTPIEVMIEDGYPSVYNDPNLYESYKNIMIQKLNSTSFIECDKPSLLSEDFSYYQKQAKGIYAYIGTKNRSKNIVFPNHHYQFDIDEDVLEFGMMVHLLTIKNYLI